MINVKDLHIGNEARREIQKDSAFSEILSGAKNAQDSAVILKLQKEFVSPKVNMNISKDTSEHPGNLNINLEKSDYSSVSAYDSSQKTLPADKRDRWLKRKIKIKSIELNQRYKNERGNLIRELITNYIHNCPKVLFISLPIFALLLKLLYIRRKQFYYVDHGIFSLHLYIFSFLILLILFGIGGLHTYTGWGWLNWLIGLIIIYAFIYYYKAMRKFYGQRRAKTIMKYILLCILSFFIQLAIFTGAIIFTVFET